MFCPECGKALPNASTRVCPSCKTSVLLPPGAVFAPIRTVSKRCTAALILGLLTALFGTLTLLCRILDTRLPVLGAAAGTTFFLAPLACVFGLMGVLVRLRHPEKRGLIRAVLGLLLGLLFGALAAYCVLRRMLLY